jgi:hypothetical protein
LSILLKGKYANDTGSKRITDVFEFKRISGEGFPDCGTDCLADDIYRRVSETGSKGWKENRCMANAGFTGVGWTAGTA